MGLFLANRTVTRWACWNQSPFLEQQKTRKKPGQKGRPILHSCFTRPCEIWYKEKAHFDPTDPALAFFLFSVGPFFVEPMAGYL